MLMPSPYSHGRSGAAGFTLVEVLVALAILSGTMVVLYGAMGDAASRLARAQAEAGAVALAQSKLDEVGLTIAPIVGDVSGAQGPYAWTVSIAVSGTAEERVAWPAVLAEVSVNVTWSDGAQKHALAVRTLKLLPKGG